MVSGEGTFGLNRGGDDLRRPYYGNSLLGCGLLILYHGMNTFQRLGRDYPLGLEDGQGWSKFVIILLLSIYNIGILVFNLTHPRPTMLPTPLPHINDLTLPPVTYTHPARRRRHPLLTINRTSPLLIFYLLLLFYTR